MAYICFCKDIENSLPLRQAHTAAHLKYIESIMEHVLVAGPMSVPYDSSVFIYSVDDHQTALQLLHNDPYYTAGIYREVDCRPFLPAAGHWIGGKTW